jgi:hypothetical protein
MEEEMEQTLTFSQEAEDEHSIKWLKIFSQEAGHEITADDAGASLHVSSMPASQHIQHAFNGERERRNPLNFEIQNFNKCCKAFNARPRLCTGSG